MAYEKEVDDADNEEEPLEEVRGGGGGGGGGRKKTIKAKAKSNFILRNQVIAFLPTSSPNASSTASSFNNCRTDVKGNVQLYLNVTLQRQIRSTKVHTNILRGIRKYSAFVFTLTWDGINSTNCSGPVSYSGNLKPTNIFRSTLTFGASLELLQQRTSTGGAAGGEPSPSAEDNENAKEGPTDEDTPSPALSDDVGGIDGMILSSIKTDLRCKDRLCNQHFLGSCLQLYCMKKIPADEKKRGHAKNNTHRNGAKQPLSYTPGSQDEFTLMRQKIIAENQNKSKPQKASTKTKTLPSTKPTKKRVPPTKKLVPPTNKLVPQNKYSLGQLLPLIHLTLRKSKSK